MELRLQAEIDKLEASGAVHKSDARDLRTKCEEL